LPDVDFEKKSPKHLHTLVSNDFDRQAGGDSIAMLLRTAKGDSALHP
jgi:hypothetical protein